VPPSLRVTLFLSFRECVKDHTGGHTQEADEKREVISFGGVCMIASGKGFDYPSQKGHENGCPSHGEEINQGHDGS